jgi:hypothetical protein
MPLNKRLFLLQGFGDEQGRNFAVYILRGVRKTMVSALWLNLGGVFTATNQTMTLAAF